MNYLAELLAVLMIIWFICVMYITYIFGKITFSHTNSRIAIYKYHAYIVTYIFAIPILIIALALMKVIGV